MAVKKLYRKQQGRMIAGVCNGIADYFEIDPTIVRLAWLICIFAAGGGLLAALIASLIFKSQMKTVRRKTGADRYIRKGSFSLTRVQDVYLYTSTTRTRIETSSPSGRGGGGGGGFTGSSGTHHTGHGGSF